MDLMTAAHLARPRRKGGSMSPLSRVTAALIAAIALAASAIVPEITQARSGARHHRTHHHLTRSTRGKGAVLHAIAAALAPPSGTILHERAMVTAAGRAPTLFEVWEQADAPQAYRVIKVGHEASWNGSAFSIYDPQANTITVSRSSGPRSGPSHAPVDYAASLRALVQSGQASVAGTSTIDGVPAYELSVGGNEDVLPAGSTVYVAESDYYPLVMDYNANGGETVNFDAYEYLPASSANLRLLDVAAQHPEVRVIEVSEQTSTTRSG
jgi:hypothetical protein